MSDMLHRMIQLGKLNIFDSILDAGCWSGRDALLLQSLGFNVSAFDGSNEMVERLKKETTLNVQQCLFSEFSEKNKYNAIWCCAALLHVPPVNFKDAVTRLAQSLIKGGVFYFSIKKPVYEDAQE